jgi:uncharacterized protein
MNKELYNIIPYLSGNRAINEKLTIYICENFTCNMPVYNIDDALLLINKADE